MTTGNDYITMNIYHATMTPQQLHAVLLIDADIRLTREKHP